MSQLHREYFNQLSGQWNDMVQLEMDLQAHLIEFGVKANDRVLDVGAGTGRLTCQIASLVGVDGKVLAVDIANEMLQKVDRSNKNTICLCSDACYNALKNELFDKIICFSTFPHILNQTLALNEFYRLLKPNGKLLIFHTKCSRQLNTFHHDLNDVVCHDELPKADMLEQMAKSAGFVSQKTVEHPELYWVECSKSKN